ncbi:MAG TPA: hypothetical protein HPP77_08845, partial [Candidatus Hydrogenedentes bacterium]|nr:hypothetical protein [Candidatus Hydrogenedentota bacterium]
MLRMMVVTLVVVVLAGLRIPAVQAEDKQVLFLSKSQAFEHGPVARAEGRPSLCDVVLGKLVQEIGGTFHSTKDASLINAEELDKYDLVVLYTQGDLTQPSVDGAAPMGANGVAELIEWVENGGGLVGFHAAADTFRV